MFRQDGISYERLRAIVMDEEAKTKDGSLRYKGYILVENENPNKRGGDQVQILKENGTPVSTAKNIQAAKEAVDSLRKYYGLDK